MPPITYTIPVATCDIFKIILNKNYIIFFHFMRCFSQKMIYNR